VVLGLVSLKGISGRNEAHRRPCSLAAGGHAGGAALARAGGDQRDTGRGRGLKTELRRQVSSAGLGQRLANSWRDKHYPNQKVDAASLVYTKAPQIIRAFDEGALIRSRRGRFLAIPTENAPRKGADGRRISPSTFPEHRFGPLRFVGRSSGPSLLVVDGLRASFSRKTGELRGFRRATDRARRSGQGLTTVVMFLLVPQVKLSKRLDVARAAERWSGQLPALIEQQLRAE
jgi:hypothetical protein